MCRPMTTKSNSQKEVFLDVYNDPVYMSVITTADEFEEKFREQVLRQQAFRADPSNLEPYVAERPQAPPVEDLVDDEPAPAAAAPSSALTDVPGDITPFSLAATVDPLAAGLSMEGLQQPTSTMVLQQQANPMMKESPLAPYPCRELPAGHSTWI